MAEIKPRSPSSPSTISDDPAILDAFLELATIRDENALLRKALMLLTQAFQAEAGSILVQARTPQRLRLGNFPPEALAVVERWETAIERRLLERMWRIPSADEIPISVNRLAENKLILINTPLLRDTRVIGSVCLICPAGQPFGLAMRRRLGKFGRGIGQLASLAADLSLAQQRLNRLGFFYQVGQELVTSFDLNEFLSNTMQLAADVMDAAASSLMLIDEEKRDLVFEVSHGGSSHLLRRQRLSIDEGIAGWVARTGKPTIVNEPRSDPRFNPRVDVRTGFLTQSIAAVPLKIKGRTIGVLEVLNKYSGGFDTEDLRLLTSIGAQAAIAIENARLYASLREEHDNIIQAQEDVRRELARNLHDGTVQMLSAISMSIDHLQRLMEVRPEAAHSELDALRKLVHRAAREARMVLFELRPIILETQGLVPTLESYVEQLNETESFAVHFKPATLPRQFDTRIAGTIFSIVQEAINNAKRHAAARNVWITMTTTNNVLAVEVRDDGRGFDVAAVADAYERRGSFGLLNMRERARLIDGHLSIRSSTRPPDQGTSITLTVPLPPLRDYETRPIPTVEFDE
ncbi:MAG: GAF domain-containing sensor histidine kinase [Anaerolineae bacterium]